MFSSPYHYMVHRINLPSLPNAEEINETISGAYDSKILTCTCIHRWCYPVSSMYQVSFCSLTWINTCHLHRTEWQILLWCQFLEKKAKTQRRVMWLIQGHWGFHNTNTSYKHQRSASDWHTDRQAAMGLHSDWQTLDQTEGMDKTIKVSGYSSTSLFTFTKCSLGLSFFFFFSSSSQIKAPSNIVFCFCKPCKHMVSTHPKRWKITYQNTVLTKCRNTGNTKRCKKKMQY